MKDFNIRLFQDFSANEWDELLDTFDATINYTAWFINYIEVLNVSFNIKNLTIAIFTNDDTCVAIVPLYIEKIDNQWQVSMGQEPVYAPIFSINILTKEILECYRYIISYIDDMAKKHQCVLARFQYPPLLYTKDSFNHFNKFGYKDVILYPDWYIFKSKQSYVIDLKDTKKIRKGHKANVVSTKKITKLIVLDKKSYNQELFDRYVKFHYKVKGPNRTLEAFNLDSMAIMNGFEAIMLCEYKEKLVGAVALHMYNKKAKYNSSVQLYDVGKGIYPNHFLLSSAIDFLKENEFELFEIGEQVELSDLYQLSKKEKNLSHFKAGWGGDLMPCMKAQKEFNRV